MNDRRGMTNRNRVADPTGERGFTLVELLVVIAIIAILTGVLLPTLAGAKQRALAINCLSNSRQLQIAWQNYATDNQDKIVWNGSQQILTGPVEPCRPVFIWAGLISIAGWLGAASGSTNTADGLNYNQMVTTGLLWPYASGLGIYRCPGRMKSS